MYCGVLSSGEENKIKNRQGALAAPTREDGACYLQSFFWYVHKESSKFVLVSLLGTRWRIGWIDGSRLHDT
jgi:hypothetical protein